MVVRSRESNCDRLDSALLSALLLRRRTAATNSEHVNRSSVKSHPFGVKLKIRLLGLTFLFDEQYVNHRNVSLKPPELILNTSSLLWNETVKTPILLIKLTVTRLLLPVPPSHIQREVG